MPYSLNPATLLIRIRDTDNLATESLHADPAPETADALTTAIATRHRPRLVRWLTPRRWRRAATR